MNRLKKSRQEKGYKNVTDDDDGVIVINDQSSCTRNMKERLHETHRNITDFAKNGAPASSASIKVKGIGNISKQSKCHMSLLRMDWLTLRCFHHESNITDCREWPTDSWGDCLRHDNRRGILDRVVRQALSSIIIWKWDLTAGRQRIYKRSHWSENGLPSLLLLFISVFSFPLMLFPDSLRSNITEAVRDDNETQKHTHTWITLRNTYMGERVSVMSHMCEYWTRDVLLELICSCITLWRHFCHNFPSVSSSKSSWICTTSSSSSSLILLQEDSQPCMSFHAISSECLFSRNRDSY